MKIQIKGRNVAVTGALEEYADEKLARLHRYLQQRSIDEVSRVELELSVEKNKSIANSKVAEATIFTKGPVIRAKESSTDMYAAIDLVTDKLQRQVKKYHDKKIAKTGRRAPAAVPASAAAQAELNEAVAAGSGSNGGEPEEVEFLVSSDEKHAEVVKVKRFTLKPMSVDEATLQLELVGHDFFVFTNAETNDTNVLYRRRDGQYGLIVPAR